MSQYSRRLERFCNSVEGTYFDEERDDKVACAFKGGFLQVNTDNGDITMSVELRNGHLDTFKGKDFTY